MVTIAHCEAAQTCWYRCRATLFGETWSDGPLTWMREDDAQNLMFPTRIPGDALRRGLERARDSGVRMVGAWLGSDVDASALAAAGFERGWAPWWMTPPVAAGGAEGGPSIALPQGTAAYRGEDTHSRAAPAVSRPPTRPS